MCSEEQTVACTLGYSQLSLFHNSVQESRVYFHLRGISMYPDIPFYSMLLCPIYTGITVSLGV